MTLDEMAQEMATEFGEQYGDLDISDQFKKWAQQAIEEVIGSARWLFRNDRETVPLVDDTAVYTLTSDVEGVRTAYLSTGGLATQRRVSYYAVESVLARGNSLGESGVPQAWFYEGWDDGAHALQIRVWPVPDAAAVAAWPELTLEVTKRPASLSADDTIPLPLQYLNVIRDGVRFRVKMNDGDAQSAEAFRALFNEGLSYLNSKFHGAEEGGSSLRVKRRKAVRQAPAASEIG